MTSVVAGTGLGLFDTSLNQLNGFGSVGNAQIGRGREAAYVNVSNGNLVVTAQDEFLAAVGLDSVLARTYNSQGSLDGDNNDGWRLSTSRGLNVNSLTNALKLAINRTNGDGNVSQFSYDSALGVWVSDSGNGSRDVIDFVTGGYWEYRQDGGLLVERYDNNGKLLSVRDEFSRTITYGYTGSQVTSIVDQSGQTIYLDYAGNKISDIRLVGYWPGAADTGQMRTLARVRYSYDDFGRLSQVSVDMSEDNSIQDGNIFFTRFEYELLTTRISKITQRDGSSLEITYDLPLLGIAKVKTLKDGEGRTTNFSYDALQRITSVVDGKGQTTVYTYDANDRLTDVLSPAVNGATARTSYTYDSRGNVTQILDGAGRISVFQYDARDNLIYSRDSMGNTVTRIFDGLDQLTSETRYRVPDPDGAGSQEATGYLTERYYYNSFRQLRYKLSADGVVTEYYYDQSGEPSASLTYAGGRYTSSNFAFGDITAWIAAQDKTKIIRVDTLYDLTGQVKAVTSYARTDASGAGINDGSQSSRLFVHDFSGRLLTEYDARGSTAFNAGSVISGGAYLTRYYYDGLGRQTQTVDATGRVTVTQFNDALRNVITTAPNGLVTTKTYNKAGDLVWVTQSAPSIQTILTNYEYDEKGRLKAAVKSGTIPARTSYAYDARDRLISVTDAVGNVTRTSYNDANQIIEIRALASPSEQGSFDRIESRYYDDAGRLAYVQNGEGYVTGYIYDGAGRLVIEGRLALVHARPGGGKAADLTLNFSDDDRFDRYIYDNDGRLRAHWAADGGLTEYKYDGAGREIKRLKYGKAVAYSASIGTMVSAATDSRDRIFVTQYNGKNEVVQTIDEGLFSTSYQYDAAGNLTSKVRIDPLQGTRSETWTYDELGRLTTYVDFHGSVTRHTYDGVSGFLISTTIADGQSDAAGISEARSTTKRYDALGRVTESIGGEGTAAWQAASNPQKESVWGRYRSSNVYDQRGRLIKTTDADAKSTVYYYDQLDRLLYTVNSMGEVRGWHYSAFGEVDGTVEYAQRLSNVAGLTGGGLINSGLEFSNSFVSDPANRTTYFDYDRDGKRKRVIDALQYTVNTEYNAFGEVAARFSSISKVLGAVRQTERWTYSKIGLVQTETIDAGGRLLLKQNTYDVFGQVTDFVDGNGNSWSKRYDKLGRVVGTTDPLNGSTITTYDAFDRVLTITDRSLNVTRFQYDDSLRQTKITTPEGVVTTIIENRHGQQISISLAAAVGAEITKYEYDRDGRLARTEMPSDSSGSRIVRNDYSESSLLRTSTDERGIVTAYSYDGARRLLTRTVDFGSGINSITGESYKNFITTYEYNTSGNAIRITDANGAVTEAVFDSLGQKLAVIQDANGLKLGTVYKYDGLGRVLTLMEGVTVSGAVGDANRVGTWSFSDSADRVTSYAYDNAGRRTWQTQGLAGESVSTQYFYDDNNNVIKTIDGAANVARNFYDKNNRLMASVDASGAVVGYGYDAEGHLTFKKKYATFVNPAALTDGSSLPDLIALLVGNAESDQTETSVFDKDGRLRFVVDALRSLREIQYDTAGRVVRTIDYYIRVPDNQALTLTNLIALTGSKSSYKPGELTLTPGSSIFSSGLGYRLTYTSGGNLVLSKCTDSGTYVNVWSSGTSSSPGSVVYQADGDLVIKNAQQQIIWSALTGGNTGGRFEILESGALQIVNAAGTVLWAGGAVSNQQIVLGVAKRYIYSKEGWLRYEIDRFSRITKSEYDAAGNLIKKTIFAQVALSAMPDQAYLDQLTQSAAYKNDSANQIERFVYDALGRLRFEISSVGAITERDYDELGRVKAATTYANSLPAGSSIALRDLETLTTTPGFANLAKDKASTTIYDAAGRALYIVDGIGKITRNSYNKAGGQESSIQYAKKLDQNLAITKANIEAALAQSGYSDTTANNIVRRYYTSGGLLKYEIDSRNALSHYIYDGAGRLKQTIQYVDLLSSQEALSESQIDAKVAAPSVRFKAGNRVQTTIYDAAGRPAYELNSEGEVVKRVYNALGNVVKSVSYAQRLQVADPSTVSGAYIEQHLSEVNSRILRYVYDAVGRQRYELSALKDNGTNPASWQVYVVEHRYNQIGWLTDTYSYSKDMALGKDSPVISDVQGLVSQNLDSARDRHTSRTYDYVGRMLSESVDLTASQKLTEQYSYDIFGNKKTYTNQKGAIWRYDYDAANRLIREETPQVDVATTSNLQDFTVPDSSLSGAVLWGQDFDSDVLGLTFEGNLIGTARADGQIKFTGSTETRAIGTRPRDLTTLAASDYYVFRTEVMTASTVNASNIIRAGVRTALGGAILNAGFDGDKLFVSYGSGPAYTVVQLGYTKAGVGYVVEVVVGKTDSHLFVYEKGSRREDGFVYHTTTVIANARTELSGQGGGHSITNTCEYKASGSFSGDDAQNGLTGRYTANSGTTAIERTRYDDNINFSFSGNVSGVPQGTLPQDIPSSDYIVYWTGGIQVEKSGFYTFYVGGDDGYELRIDGKIIVTNFKSGPFDEESGGIELEAGKRYDFALDFVQYTLTAAIQLSWSRPGMAREVVPTKALFRSVTGSNARKVLLNPVKANSDLMVERVSIVNTFHYDVFGNIDSRVEAYGSAKQKQTLYDYDAAGNQIGSSVVGGTAIYDRAEYTNAANSGLATNRTRLEVVTAQKSTTFFDALGNAIKFIDVGGGKSYKTYDGNGRLRYEVNALGDLTGYSYDALGNCTEITRYGFRVSVDVDVYTTEAINSIVARPENAGLKRTITSFYDELGRVIRIEQSQVYTYDSDSAWETTALQANRFFTASPTIKRDYNAFGDLIRESALKNKLADSWLETYYYWDRTGRKVAQIDPSGYLTTWEYKDSSIKEVQYVTAAMNWSLDQYSFVSSNGYWMAFPFTGPQGVASNIQYRDHNGVLLQNQYINGDRISVSSYDRAGRQISNTLKGIDTFSFSADPNLEGKITLASTNSDLTTYFDYDEVGNLRAVVKPDGAITYTYYDALGRVTAIASPSTRTDVAQQKYPIIKYYRDIFGNIVRETRNAEGATAASVTSFTADSAREVRYIDRKFDVLGNITSEVDGNGNAVFYSYDIYGNLAKKWTSFSGPTGVDQLVGAVYSFDALGRQIESYEYGNDGVSRKTQYSYNSYGEVAAKGTDDKWQEQYFYDDAGRMWKSRDAHGIETINIYDLGGRVTAQYRSPSSSLMNLTQAEVESLSVASPFAYQRTQNIYNNSGQLVEQRQPTFFAYASATAFGANTIPVVKQVFDRWGDLIELVDASQRSKWFDYDLRGNLVRVRDVAFSADTEQGAGSSLQTPTTAYGYDKVGNRIATLDARGFLSVNSYTKSGMLEKEFRADRSYVLHSYNINNLEISRSDELWTNYYDGNDQLVRRGVGDVNAINYINNDAIYRYDGLGHQTEVLTKKSTHVWAKQTMAYDSLGRIARSVNPSGIAVSYAYNSLDQKTLETDANNNIQSWDYDDYGNITSHRNLGGESIYYGTSRLGEILQAGGVSYSYQAGRLISTSHDGKTTNYYLDVRGLRVAEFDYQQNNLIRSVSIQNDESGKVFRVTERRVGEAFDRVSQTYTYDLMGNRKQVTTTYRNFASQQAIKDFYYTYDAMGRIIVSQGVRASSGYIDKGSSGYELEYDNKGNRISERRLENSTEKQRKYYYDSENRLRLVTLYSPAAGEIKLLEKVYNNIGNVVISRDFTPDGAAILNQHYYNYYTDGRIQSQRDIKSGFYKDQVYFDLNDSYDAAGNLKKYLYVISNYGTPIYYEYTYNYLLKDRYLQYTEKVVQNFSTSSYGLSVQQYDASYNVASVSLYDNTTLRNKRAFTVNGAGETTFKDEITYNNSPVNDAFYFYANGHQTGFFDQKGSVDFDQNYQPIGAEYPALTGSSYAALDGDTPSSVALAAFGDASLWYLISDANGLSGGPDELVGAGRRLTIPNVVGNLRNNSTTFKPYDPSAIIGDTTPTVPPPKRQCNTLAVVIVLIVVAIVTVATAGATSAGINWALAGTALEGTSGAALGTAVVSGAVGGAAGAAAGQVVGDTLDISDGFSWKAVGKGALSGAITAGLDKAASFVDLSFLGQASEIARAALVNAAVQRTGVLLHMQQDFSWGAVAGSALAQGLSGRTGTAVDHFFSSSDSVLQNFSRGLAAGLIRQTVQVLLDRNGRVRPAEIAADAFGNALGNSIVGAIQFSSQQEQLRNTFDKANVPYTVDADGNVRATSDSTQRAAEALIKSGAGVDKAATILGDADVQGAFGGIDAANARIAANQDSFNEALDGLDSSITFTPLDSGPPVGAPIPLDQASADFLAQSGYGSRGIGAGSVDPTQGSFDSDNPIAQALRPVGDAATALANLNDRFSGLADAIVIAGGAVVGGGGVGQVVGRVFKAVGGQAVDYVQGKIHDLAVGKLDSYLEQNTDLNSLTRSLISQAGGFGIDAVFGTVAGIGSKQVISDAQNVRNIDRKLDRYPGPKPGYAENPAHVPGQRGFNPRKTPLPDDAAQTFKNTVPNDPINPTAWFGRNAEGQIYRYSLGGDGTAHFSGIDGVGDGTRNLTKYALDRLKGK